MSVRETRRPAPPPPELEGEDEVDLGRYWSAIAARWWLPLVGLLAGALIGYLVAVGGSQTYRAQAVVSLGTPLAVGGGVLPSVQTNAAAVRQIVSAESTSRRDEDDRPQQAELGRRRRRTRPARRGARGAPVGAGRAAPRPPPRSVTSA